MANPKDKLLPKLKQLNTTHPALNRMRSKAMQVSGNEAITDYSRMHHRHNRS
ncbi:YhhA family cyclophane-containing RiPP [Chryseobacterium bernardetii]